jgi:hypothetical protein
VLLFGDSVSGANLVDVIIEWQYYDAVVSTSAGQSPTCQTYRNNGELPLRLCDEGYGVFMLQEGLRDAG